MTNHQNPYQTPTEPAVLPARTGVSWKSFVRLNVAVAIALGVLVLVSLAWAKYEQFQMSQRVGRYTTYDHEYHFYPMRGLILLALIFAIPNIALLVVKFSRGRQSDEPRSLGSTDQQRFDNTAGH